MERRSFDITVDGEPIELTEDNHGIAHFRDEPEKDYLDITVYEGDEEGHTLLFRQRRLMLWMGRVAVLEGDAEIIEEMEEEHGPFSGYTGWNSKVLVEDSPSEFESEMYTRLLLRDLADASGVPEDFTRKEEPDAD